MSRSISVAFFLCVSVGMTAQAQQDQPKVVKINDSIYMAALGANLWLPKTQSEMETRKSCLHADTLCRRN
jgi:hypothetical protein